MDLKGKVKRMPEVKTGWYTAEGRPPIFVDSQIRAFVLYRVGSSARQQLTFSGVLAADLEAGGYRWSHK